MAVAGKPGGGGGGGAGGEKGDTGKNGAEDVWGVASSESCMVAPGAGVRIVFMS